MSIWNLIDEEDVDIDIDAKEVNIIVASDKNGNIYAFLPFSLWENINNRIQDAKKADAKND